MCGFVYAVVKRKQIFTVNLGIDRKTEYQSTLPEKVRNVASLVTVVEIVIGEITL
jgi:hypothetical protein